MIVFSKFLDVTCPESIKCETTGKNPSFTIRFSSDGFIPFPQVLLHGQGKQKLIRGEAITQTSAKDGKYTYTAKVPAGLLNSGEISVQVEGCRTPDLSLATGDDWIKEFRQLKLLDSQIKKPKIEVIDNIKVIKITKVMK